MDKKILYPKTIEDLMVNVSFLIEHEQNFELIENLTLWVKWFEGLNYNLNNELNDDEYLRAYYYDGIFALQIWKHSDFVDSCLKTLITNKFNVYCDDDTVIIDE